MSCAAYPEQCGGGTCCECRLAKAHRLWSADTARIASLEAVLNEIASWGEGETVGPGFDCPYHAQLARDALDSGADGKGVE